MVFLEPDNPVYNTLILYIFFVILFLIIKPNFMYDKKKKKFKSFGCKKGHTIFCFPIVTISCAIILYFIFLLFEILFNY